MPNAWVVLTDGDPDLIRAAFFGPTAEEAATDWRDANAGGSAVVQAHFVNYFLQVTL